MPRSSRFSLAHLVATLALVPVLTGAQSSGTITLGGDTSPPGSTPPAGALIRLRLSGVPSLTGSGALRCAVGQSIDFQLEGLNAAGERVALEPYAPQIRSTNSQVVMAEPGFGSIYIVRAMCQGNGEAWVVVDAGGARTNFPVLAGTARSKAAPSAPPADAREIVVQPPTDINAVSTAVGSTPVIGSAGASGTPAPRTQRAAPVSSGPSTAASQAMTPPPPPPPPAPPPSPAPVPITDLELRVFDTGHMDGTSRKSLSGQCPAGKIALSVTLAPYGTVKQIGLDSQYKYGVNMGDVNNDPLPIGWNYLLEGTGSARMYLLCVHQP